MRVALADAGDAMDDANFEHQTANGAILRLTKEVTTLSVPHFKPTCSILVWSLPIMPLLQYNLGLMLKSLSHSHLASSFMLVLGGDSIMSTVL
jgi:hypothetical protein